MQVYSITLGWRANQIEELLKNLIGELTIQFESTVGIFVTAAEDVLTTQEFVHIVFKNYSKNRGST
jgi:hypothetical protein